jgi:hypothetical protein
VEVIVPGSSPFSIKFLVALPALLLTGSLCLTGCDGAEDVPSSRAASSTSQSTASSSSKSTAHSSSQPSASCNSNRIGADCGPASSSSDNAVGEPTPIVRDLIPVAPKCVFVGSLPEAGASVLDGLYPDTSSSASAFTNACQYAEGKRYESTTLHNVGFDRLDQWQLSFAQGGKFYSLQSDVTLSGSYRCHNNTAMLEFDVNLNMPNREVRFLDASARMISYAHSEGQKPIYYLRVLNNILCHEAQPVCGLSRVLCPDGLCNPEYQTYTNSCTAAASGAKIAYEGFCGALDSQSVEAKIQSPTLCQANYEPVCAKYTPKTQGALSCCEGEICNGFYKTYSNACAANNDNAQVAFNGECRDYDLEGVTGIIFLPPTQLVDVLPRGYKVSEASIEGNELTFTASYSGCSQRTLSFYVDQNAFSEEGKASPVASIKWSVSDGKADAVTCQAVFSSRHRVDLTPLKAAFRKAFPTAEGVINLGELGEYRF